MSSKKPKNFIKFPIYLMATVIILGVVVFISVVMQTRGQLLDAFGERSNALATFTMSEIDRGVENTILDIQLFANRIKEKDEFTESNDFFSELEDVDEVIRVRDEEWKNTDPETPNKLMIDILGKEFSKELIKDFPYGPRDGLSEADTQTQYAEIFVTNAYGVNLAQTNITSDYYQADEEWWQVASKEGIHIDDVEFDGSAQKHILAISSGIFDDEANLLGVVKVAWDIDEIINLLGVIEIERKDRKIFGDTTNLTLLTKDLDVIYSSRDDLDFLDNMSEEEVSNVALSANSDDVYSISEGFDLDNKKVARFVTFAKSSGFESFGGLDWILIFEQDIDEVLSPIEITQRIIGIIIAIFIILIFYLVYVYTKRIEAIQKMKEEFISIASHELKTPVTNAQWALETLADINHIPKSAQEWLDTISDNVNQMNVLVNDLLNLSRLESGRLQINPQKLDISIELNNVIKKLKEFAKKNKIEMKVSVLDDANQKVPLDPSIFNLILTNLISNAIKYSPDGGDVNIILEKVDDKFKVTVKDNGIGIPADVQKNIFKKFYRANNAENSEINGTGLGLFVIKNISQKLGGNIWFTSKEKVGSTFYFTLPEKGMKKGKIRSN